MNLFKRSRYSVIRKPKKSIILAGIIYGISILLMIAVAINNHQEAVQNEIRNQVGASLRLELCREDETQRMIEYSDVYDVEFELGGVPSVMFTAPSYFYTLINDDIEKFSQVEGISEFNINSVPLEVFPVGFENIAAGGQGGDQDLVNISGVLNLRLLDEVLHEFITLKEGRWIEASDMNSDVNHLVISEDLAQKNGLAVGDEMTFEWRDMELDVMLEARGIERRDSIPLSGTIVGIFSIEHPIPNFMNVYSIENTIFANLDFREEAIQAMDTYFYTLATFHVGDVDYYDEIRQNIKAVDINWERYELVDADAMLDRLSGNFSALEQISTMLFSVVMVAGFSMLLLIFIFWIRNRMHEIAILLSLGVEKMKIISQIICEALLIATVSFALCFVTAPVIPQLIDSNLLSTALQDEEILSDAMAVQGGGGIAEAVNEHFYEQAISEIPITFHVMVIVMVSITILIVLSAIVATIPIMRMKPREIFSKMS